MHMWSLKIVHILDKFYSPERSNNHCVHILNITFTIHILLTFNENLKKDFSHSFAIRVNVDVTRISNEYKMLQPFREIAIHRK